MKQRKKGGWKSRTQNVNLLVRFLTYLVEQTMIIAESSRWRFESFKIEKLFFVVRLNDVSLKSNAVERQWTQTLFTKSSCELDNQRQNVTCLTLLSQSQKDLQCEATNTDKNKTKQNKQSQQSIIQAPLSAATCTREWKKGPTRYLI